MLKSAPLGDGKSPGTHSLSVPHELADACDAKHTADIAKTVAILFMFNSPLILMFADILRQQQIVFMSEDSPRMLDKSTALPSIMID